MNITRPQLRRLQQLPAPPRYIRAQAQRHADMTAKEQLALRAGLRAWAIPNGWNTHDVDNYLRLMGR